MKCTKFTKNNGIKIKREIDGETNLYFYCTEAVDEKELSELLIS